MVATLSDEEISHYARHLLLPEVGMEGQRKLKSASALIVGVGGLGSPIALYLAAAGVGRIGLVDFDRVEDSNLQRQIIHSAAGIGSFKVDTAKQRMLGLNPHITVETFNEPFNPSNARQIAEDYDLIVDGLDNFPTRYLINDLCVLTNKPYIYGSIFRFDGQVSVFDAKRGPCYRCLFPEPPPPEIALANAQDGVFGVLPGTIGTLQATEALKIILNIGEPLVGRLLLYSALESTFTIVKLQKNSHCRICGEKPDITDLLDDQVVSGMPD